MKNRHQKSTIFSPLVFHRLRPHDRNAHFRRFSLISGSLSKSRDLGVADLCRKPQETADFRRKAQKTAEFLQKPVSPICCLPFGARLKKAGKKKEPKPKLFGPDIFGWAGGLPREGVGAEEFSMSLETRETKLFWRDIPGFCRDIPGFCRDIPEVPEKIWKKTKKFVFNFRSLKRHINLRKIPGFPWDTRRDKQGSTGRCPRDFLLSI